MKNFYIRPENARNDTTLILDCHYLCYQAWFTMRGLSYDGVNTGIIFGFLGRVLNLAQKFNTSDVHFCWDSKHSYRRESYPEYKAKRRPDLPKEEMAALMKAKKAFVLLRKEILPSIGLKRCHVQKGIEADDLIAILTQGKIGSYVIVSADEDLYQLLAANVKMYNPTKKEMMTRKRLLEEKRLTPDQWVQMKCLAGCHSDNVKGIPRIGELSATRFLCREFSRRPQHQINRLVAGDENRTVERNWPLIKLPHIRTREPKNAGEMNQFNEEAFVKLCKQYGMESFLQEDKLNEWREVWKI